MKVSTDKYIQVKYRYMKHVVMQYFVTSHHWKYIQNRKV